MHFAEPIPKRFVVCKDGIVSFPPLDPSLNNFDISSLQVSCICFLQQVFVENLTNFCATIYMTFSLSEKEHEKSMPCH